MLKILHRIFVISQGKPWVVFVENKASLGTLKSKVNCNKKY